MLGDNRPALSLSPNPAPRFAARSRHPSRQTRVRGLRAGGALSRRALFRMEEEGIIIKT